MAQKLKILKVISSLIQIVILILIFISFFSPWYSYTYSGLITTTQGTESFQGVVITQNGSPTSRTWADTDQSSMQTLYTVILVIVIFAFVFAFILGVVMLLVTFGSSLPLRFRLGLNFLKNKVKKLALIFALLQLALLCGAALIFYLEHAKVFTKDWQNNNGGSSCSMDVCISFKAASCGPSFGWDLMLACLILTLIQMVLLAIYSFQVIKKNKGYKKITSSRGTLWS